MRVFVFTQKQIEAAFAARIEAAGDDAAERDRRRIERRVFEAFAAAPEARPLLAPTGLYCFTRDQWAEAYGGWLAREKLRRPDAAPAIERHGGALDALMASRWPIEAKLLVRECLGEEDLVEEGQPEREAAVG